MVWAYIARRSATSFRLSFCSILAPPKRMDNSSPLSVIVASSPSDGHRKRPFSSRLKYSQNPSPSHCSIFTRSRLRLQNTNNAPSNGSSLKLLSTIVAMLLAVTMLAGIVPTALGARTDARFLSLTVNETNF